MFGEIENGCGGPKNRKKNIIFFSISELSGKAQLLIAQIVQREKCGCLMILFLPERSHKINILEKKCLVFIKLCWRRCKYSIV